MTDAIRLAPPPTTGFPNTQIPEHVKTKDKHISMSITRTLTDVLCTGGRVLLHGALHVDRRARAREEEARVRHLAYLVTIFIYNSRTLKYVRRRSEAFSTSQP